MKRKVAMLQPNYIPWKGVFDLISRVDVFVFYDDVQYTKRDWRNRNKIKTKDGELWLSVPVNAHRGQLICDVEIDQSTAWQESHYKTIKNSYSRAPYFKEFEYLLEEIYLKQKWKKIVEVDVFATKLIAKALGLNPDWVISSELKKTGSKDGEKVIEICKELDCDYFINGPASKDFMNQGKFDEAGIQLDYITYDYPEYPQIHGDFIHGVSILDTLFNCGPEAHKFIFNNELRSLTSG